MNMYFLSKVKYNILKFFTKYWMYILGVLLVILPWIMNLCIVCFESKGIIFESSVFSINYEQFFKEFWKNLGVFKNGIHSPELIQYIPIYTLIYYLQKITGNQAVVYLLLIIICYLFSYLALTSLLKKHIFYNNTLKPTERNIYVSSIGVLYYCSIPMFIYLNKSILPTLPYIVLPICLWCIYNFIEYKNKSYLLLIILLLVFGTTYNITYFVYVYFACFIYTLVLIYFAKNKFSKLKILFNVSIAFVPAALIICLSLVSLSYYGSIHQTINSYEEGMYNVNSNLVNSFRQTVDWSIFASYKGEPYHVFSHYYQNSWIKFIAFVPWILLLSLLLYDKTKNRTLRLLMMLGLLTLLFCISVEIGYKNPIFIHLYNNSVFFKIFRNTNKIAPLTWLILLVLFSYYITNISSYKKRTCIFIIFIICTVIYSYPYWHFYNSYIESRYVNKIPTSWYQLSGFINKNLTYSNKILLVPSSYILETYKWNNKKVEVRGMLADSLFKPKSYRLSKKLVGYTSFRNDIKKLYSKSSLYPKENLISKNLIKILAHHNINYVLITSDIYTKSEVTFRYNYILQDINAKLKIKLNNLEMYHVPTKLKFTNSHLGINPNITRLWGLKNYVFKIDETKSYYILHLPQPQNTNWLFVHCQDNIITQDDKYFGFKRLINSLKLYFSNKLSFEYLSTRRNDYSLVLIDKPNDLPHKNYIVAIYKAEIYFIMLLLFSILSTMIILSYLIIPNLYLKLSNRFINMFKK